MQYYPIHHKRSKLSVIGAMKDIQDYKIAKSQADLAPTIAEKTKTMWDWQKKDRARDIQIKETALEAGQLSNVEKKRKLMTEILTESAQIAKDAFDKTTTQEEFTEYLQTAYEQLKKKGPQYADELEDKDGNNVIDLAEIPRDKAMEIHAGFLKRKEMVSVSAGARRVPEDVEVEAEYKPTEGPYKEGQIKDFKEGDQFIQKKYTKGEWVPTGTKAPRYKPGVTINMPDTVTPSMKTKLQTEMFERQQAIDRLNQIEELTKDEYLTYYGQGKAKISGMLTKAGMSTDEMKKFTADYGEWASATKVHTLLWRKLITGVAGGEKEMKAIEQTTINVGDSAPTFRRKLSRQKIMAEAALQRAQFSIEHFGKTFKDLTPEQKDNVRERFPFVAAAGEEDADALLKELGYE